MSFLFQFLVQTVIVWTLKGYLGPNFCRPNLCGKFGHTISQTAIQCVAIAHASLLFHSFLTAYQRDDKDINSSSKPAPVPVFLITGTSLRQ